MDAEYGGIVSGVRRRRGWSAARWRRGKVRLAELGHRFGPRIATTDVTDLVRSINALTVRRTRCG